MKTLTFLEDFYQYLKNKHKKIVEGIFILNL